MSLSRSKRAKKPVNYCALEKGSSDDDEDFSDFTPPTKKVKNETKVKLKSKKDVENGVDIVANESLKDKNPKQRLSLEERKFQRELELAIELSAANTEPFQGFNKKNEDKENELEVFSPLRQVVDVEVHPEPRADNSVSTGNTNIVTDNVIASDINKNSDNDDASNVNNVPNNDDTRIQDVRIEVVKVNTLKENKPESDAISSLQQNTANNLVEVQQSRRTKKKKVNFIEDDESDGFSENEIQICKSETDESDYFPSPSKSKRKKEVKRVTRKSKLKPEKETRKPLSVKQANVEVKSPPKLKKESNVRRQDMGMSESLTNGSETPENFKKRAPEKKIDSVIIPKPSKSESTSHIPAKNMFQSPLLKVSTNPSPKTQARIGLRLGLSRKAPLKSLHPNASVK